MTKLTRNQVMVLLDIYRGTFRANRHMGTVAKDMARLSRRGLITSVRSPRRTRAGTALVARISKVE